MEKKDRILHIRVPEWVYEELEQFHPIPKSAVARDVLITFLQLLDIASEKDEVPLNAFKDSYKKQLIKTAREYEKNIYID